TKLCRLWWQPSRLLRKKLQASRLPLQGRREIAGGHVTRANGAAVPRKLRTSRRVRCRRLHLAKRRTGARSAWGISRPKTRATLERRHDRAGLVGNQRSWQRLFAPCAPGKQNQNRSARLRILAGVRAKRQERYHHRAAGFSFRWFMRARSKCRGH